jgi:hypothetical protein
VDRRCASRRPWIAAVAAAVAFEAAGGCRGAEQPQRHSDDALYAAEAGLQLAMDELVGVCGNPQALAELQREARTSFVAVPGLEKSVGQIYGSKLPGGATVSVTLRVKDTAPSEFFLRSLGRSPTEEKTVEWTTSCDLVKTRKVRPGGS